MARQAAPPTELPLADLLLDPENPRLPPEPGVVDRTSQDAIALYMETAYRLGRNRGIDRRAWLRPYGDAVGGAHEQSPHSRRREPPLGGSAVPD